MTCWREHLSHYHLAHSARADLCRRLGRNSGGPCFVSEGAGLAQQEPERRFLARRLEELKKSPSRMSILSVRDDYRMNDPARKAVLLARRPLQEKYAAIFGSWLPPRQLRPRP